MSDWIDINDMLPNDISMKKYHVKIQTGSMTPKEVEKVVIGKMYPNQFRFMTGDWERVTHWKEFDS